MPKEFIIDQRLVDRLEGQLTKLRNMAPSAETWDRTAIGQLYALIVQHNAKKTQREKKAMSEIQGQRRKFFGSRTSVRRKEDE